MSGIPAGLKMVSVFGGRHPCPGDEEYQQAVRLGSSLAGRGFGVLSGGYSGVMEAVSRGAAEAGGTAIGVTMKIFGSLAPNHYLTGEMQSRDFFERLEILTSKADGFIALRGGMGTLTEIGLVWNMLQTKAMHDKPLILLGAFWWPLLQSVSAHLVISPNDLALLHFVESADEALDILTQLI